MVKKNKKISKVKHVYTLILIVLIIGEFILISNSDPGLAIISLIIYIPLIIFIYRENVLAYWILFVMVIFDIILTLPNLRSNLLSSVIGLVMFLVILIVAILAYRHDVK
jgi:hypothetical protein